MLSRSLARLCQRAAFCLQGQERPREANKAGNVERQVTRCAVRRGQTRLVMHFLRVRMLSVHRYVTQGLLLTRLSRLAGNLLFFMFCLLLSGVFVMIKTSYNS